MMTKWKWRDNPKCPRCDVDESTLHVVQCQSGANKSQFKESMEPLQTWLEETTSPRIASVVRTHMKAYQRNKKVGGFRTRKASIRRLSRQQDKLGIRSFGEGFLAKEWKEAQALHYGGENAETKSKRWVIQLIKKIWEVSWDMWQARNHLIHYDKEVRDELFVQRMNVDLEVLWSEGRESKLLYRPERQFFMVTLESLLKKEEYNKVRWIDIAERYLDPERLAARENSSQGILMQWLHQPTPARLEGTPPNSPPGRHYVTLDTPIEFTQQKLTWSPKTKKRSIQSNDVTTPSGLSSQRRRCNDESAPAGLTTQQINQKESTPTGLISVQQRGNLSPARQLFHQPPIQSPGKRQRSRSTDILVTERRVQRRRPITAKKRKFKQKSLPWAPQKRPKST